MTPLPGTEVDPRSTAAARSWKRSSTWSTTASSADLSEVNAAAEPEWAVEQLYTAISLFAVTAHAPGHATALRNLTQLHAEHGRHAEALAAHGDALPLVRLVTEEFIDEYDIDEFVVPGHFEAQYERIARLDEVEQYRARARAQFDPTTAVVGSYPTT
jgi:hypothetical protein